MNARFIRPYGTFVPWGTPVPRTEVLGYSRAVPTGPRECTTVRQERRAPRTSTQDDISNVDARQRGCPIVCGSSRQRWDAKGGGRNCAARAHSAFIPSPTLRKASLSAKPRGEWGTPRQRDVHLLDLAELTRWFRDDLASELPKPGPDVAGQNVTFSCHYGASAPKAWPRISTGTPWAISHCRCRAATRRAASSAVVCAAPPFVIRSPIARRVSS